ncbi:hypothetical protein [Kutzneria sp. 744]|uniref:hypothetical protein n=1 Tax=Kutzneria sp. (strain 744) TaxID=345341 RepID=UPI001E601C2A|nr:hypothetical protein [Kutzneria sp. 744]
MSTPSGDQPSRSTPAADPTPRPTRRVFSPDYKLAIVTAVESAPPGTPVHAVAEEGVRFRDIAEAIGRQLKLPAVSLTAEEASGHFGLLAPLVSLDNPTSSALTRERFDWVPAHPGLIADIENGHYFKDAA